MDQLPVTLTLRGRKVVVTGSGTAAVRKADLALRAGANVLIVAPTHSPELAGIERHPALSLRLGKPEAEDMAGAFAVFAAAEDDPEDLRVRTLAKAAGAFVNVPDRPEWCDFSIPSMLDRSPLMIAISSAGNSPLLTRLLKERLEAAIPPAYGDLARFLGAIRDEVLDSITDKTARRRFYEELLDGPVSNRMLAGDEPGARAAFAQALDNAARDFMASPVPRGEVYLVGAGPGDPDLLTFRAVRLMQRAEVVVYDRLIGDGILSLVRRDAERIYVGKRKNQHTVPQDEISQLLVDLAREGKRVLRLKGGDPFIFGRGGEEIEMLAEHGIPFEVVPGITAAAGCACYAGIPLTHRDHAQACVFVTGHAKDGRLSLDWVTLLQPRQTLAIYMGLAVLPQLMSDFMANGADPAMPVAVIDNGTRPGQTVVTGTIETIAGLAAGADLKGPAMIIVGTVVTLRDKLDWRKPAVGAAAAPPATPAAPHVTATASHLLRKD